MALKTILALGIAVSFAVPALADEYYVVREPNTKHCTITTSKPTSERVVTQIGPLAFESREKAEDRMKVTKVCSDDATTGTKVQIEHK
jgi:hypothetical protein